MAKLKNVSNKNIVSTVGEVISHTKSTKEITAVSPLRNDVLKKDGSGLNCNKCIQNSFKVRLCTITILALR